MVEVLAENRVNRPRRGIARGVGAACAASLLLTGTSACSSDGSGLAAVRDGSNVFKLDCLQTNGYGQNGTYTTDFGDPHKIIFRGPSISPPDVWGAEVEATVGYVDKDKSGNVTKRDAQTVMSWLAVYYTGSVQSMGFSFGEGTMPDLANIHEKLPFIPAKDGHILYSVPATLEHTTLYVDWRMAPQDPNAKEVSATSLNSASIECGSYTIEGKDTVTTTGISLISGDKVKFEPEPGRPVFVGDGVQFGQPHI